ncbi:MAG TPA: hypothetical protein GXZ52_04860 [Clostridiales bacterium]|nr:hypothetical protein [Clostridiales bacterium]
MDNKDFENYIDETELSLEAILAEYKSGVLLADGERAFKDELEERSRRIMLDAMASTIGAAGISSLESESAGLDHIPGGKTEEHDLEPVPAETAEDGPDPVFVSEPLLGWEPEAEEITDLGETDEEYARADFPPPEPEPEEEDPYRPERQYSLGERLLAPIIAVLAMVAVRRHQRSQADPAEKGEGLAESKALELPPEKVARLYAGQVKPLRIRGFLAAALAAILVFLSYGYELGMTMPGALSSMRVLSLMCMLIVLAVIMLGLDIFTNGIVSLFKGAPGAETLVAVSCLLSILDSIVIALTGHARGMPFCSVSALSMVFAILGARYTCEGYRTTFRTLAMSKSPYVVTSEQGISEGERTLIKSRRGYEGFIHRSEEADPGETSYALFTPFLLVCAFVLAFLASVVKGRPEDFFHTLSALTAVCASFSALLAFPLPFSITARRLLQSGAAIAGYAGASDISRSPRVIVTDTDIFPAGTMTMESIHILEGYYTDKVISYTGSVMAASGAGLSAVFTELMRRNGCTIHRVENFSFHEGGGIEATVRGEQVYVGSSGYMNLMGIRLPRKLNAKNAVFAAINGSLVGVFTINYVPTPSVQDALVTLFHSRAVPLFAIRDFNITPLMIQQRFRMPTDGFDFPSFSERYRISAAEPSEGSPPAAVLTREGLGPLAEASERGRRLYRASRISVFISLLGSLTGLVLMFLLCLNASFDSATAGNMMTFMFLWLVPVLVVSFGLRR